ncbi:sigma-54-dependent Fis family transcriptional regulator [Enterovibrio norvegicus]|uniref:sigma-54-dependent Fis family transcriptional regulator n=1 Tax=Enterovibrio norvegicus TaxID=188144 RepID=UPI0002D33044|nr:sigma-54-dependent Fis family transcriptional regulator [Enterovibrio norvegicus]OEE61329.1 sigma-54-dependent Fis family transcriptional regulator [Enterovibrio norvegicus]TKF11434.1 sigma-54-dependent Fis family transcriptional regulator [Enterovibrio norvegicus]
MVDTIRSDASSLQQTLLIIEDDPENLRRLGRLLEDMGTVVTSSRFDAISALRHHQPHVIVMGDLVMADLTLISDILALDKKNKILALVGNENTQTVQPAFELGAFDVVGRELNDPLLKLVVKRAAHVAKVEKDLARLSKQEKREDQFVGNSSQVLQLMRMVDRVALTDVNTLIVGESGTGKGLLARATHDKGPRREAPFIAINCASVPDHLLEAELFGTESGSASEGYRVTVGKIEAAEGGTLFLDEIGDMPLALQSKLLRFMQERMMNRIGGQQPIPVDVKIVSATYQDMGSRVAEKRFREDLFYRIGEVTIHIPALRERPDDIMLLAKTFLNEFSHSMNRNILGFTEDAIEALLEHPWPGNVRELQNKVKSAVILADGNKIATADLMLTKEQKKDSGLPLNLRQVREEAERHAVSRALLRAEGNMSQTANLLGVSRPTLYTLIDKYSLQR